MSKYLLSEQNVRRLQEMSRQLGGTPVVSSPNGSRYDKTPLDDGAPDQHFRVITYCDPTNGPSWDCVDSEYGPQRIGAVYDGSGALTCDQLAGRVWAWTGATSGSRFNISGLSGQAIAAGIIHLIYCEAQYTSAGAFSGGLKVVSGTAAMPPQVQETGDDDFWRWPIATVKNVSGVTWVEQSQIGDLTMNHLGRARTTPSGAMGYSGVSGDPSGIIYIRPPRIGFDGNGRQQLVSGSGMWDKAADINMAWSGVLPLVIDSGNGNFYLALPEARLAVDGASPPKLSWNTSGSGAYVQVSSGIPVVIAVSGAPDPATQIQVSGAALQVRSKCISGVASGNCIWLVAGDYGAWGSSINVSGFTCP